MLFWICKGTQFLQKVARGQALHFRGLIRIWGKVYIGSTFSFTFCYKMLSLLLLNPENKSKLKSWLKQPNQVVSYWTGPQQQGKLAYPSEDVTQHRGGVTSQPQEKFPKSGVTIIAAKGPQQLWDSGTIFRPWVRLPVFVVCSGWYITSPHSHQYMLKLLNDHPWRCPRTGCETQCSGLGDNGGISHWLDLMISELFSSLIGSVVPVTNCSLTQTGKNYEALMD